MRIVYRVEHPGSTDDNGPYNGGRNLGTEVAILRQLLASEHELVADHPSWMVEEWVDHWGQRPYPGPAFDPAWDRKWMAGFDSVAQLREWFAPHELELLDEVGFCVALYRVDERHVVTAPKQVAFNALKAHRHKKNYSLLTDKVPAGLRVR